MTKRPARNSATCGESLEVCDDTGRVLAYLTPAEDRSIYDLLDCPTSDDELDRREREGTGRPLVEIWADLKQRELIGV